ncbi:hypothetical protein SARC_04937 [Sphaeroforma arctica JP610]|uniref:Anoctamin transmembrane domain-containing protein n=1 Tax=Sphaeroforma arctica JP610 TaxID=667725 RepID=A0A0L0G1R3_9EUKA|nr:hypothetical protein SARC_04937 [Sphaeroforma arctica JP610]KNC82779.1 hypothetical protein SARC_04937 [Sphaeroforma arctica JP610]|eukprot:XP_014156681.1 hypothetical protein SARC_04937 [Sphaeroforma arctica JP610]
MNTVQTCDESELVERISRRQFQEGTPLIDVLISEGVVEVFTLHDHKAGKELHRAAMRSVNMPIQGLFEYFGAELGMYYAWVDCYCRMLVIPSVLAIVLLVIGTGPWGRGMVSHDLEDTLSAIYAFVMIIWASIFVKVWEREASNNSLNWTDDTTSDAITDQASANRGDGRVRPGYTGKLRKDPVTGRTEVHFTAKDRRLRTLVIAPVMVAMIGAAFAVMVFGLNITGYVDEDSPIYYSILNARNPGTPGMNYPDDNVIVGLIPTIVHSVAILLLNLWFAKIAEKMCEYQNWRTQEEFEASLILKRVPFEMLASYLSLFYLAFYEGDLSKLKLELQALFMVDTVRRMVMEFVLPWLLQFRALKEQLKATDMKKSKSVDESELEKKVKKAFIKDERVDFDDYIELTVQFGYIVLFAGAFPIAGFLALAGNVLEMRTDLSKHLHVCRRSASRHANNIGPWLPVLKVISDLSVLTNAVIFAYTSRQLDSFMTDDTDFASNANNTAMRMMAILLTEHILFVIKKVVETEISSIHKTVFTTYQRRDYLRILGLNLFQAEQQKKHE